MIPLNLLADPWIPVRRRSGMAAVIAPPDISPVHEDPVIAIDWPRPDFRPASLEFLVGLLSTACPPDSQTAWRRGWRDPPDAATLHAAFRPFLHAFELDGEGPRFMQDREDFATEPNDIGTLLIEAPGEATVRRNTDLMVHRGRVEVLSRAAAAMALFTLQTYAPAGGAGNRTGLRGGGPLTTIAMPPLASGGPVPLWHLLWANVANGAVPDVSQLNRVFPWLVATRTSESGRPPTTPADVHPLQCWWGMPRRIRLDIAEAAAVCDLTGVTDARTVRTWRQRPWGTDYHAWGGAHPLSPCYRIKPGTELLYRHPQPGGIGYQHWASILSRAKSETRTIAPVIDLFPIRFADVRQNAAPWRLLASGYDMDNMKARGFTESEIPVFEPADPDAATTNDLLVTGRVEAANIVADVLARCVRRALFGDKSMVATDTSALSALKERLWLETADAFFTAAAALAAGDDADGVRDGWLRTLARASRLLFAEAAPMDASGEGHPERIAAAARQLGAVLAGYGKDGAKLYTALERPQPKSSKTPVKRRTP